MLVKLHTSLIFGGVGAPCHAAMLPCFPGGGVGAPCFHASLVLVHHAAMLPNSGVSEPYFYASLVVVLVLLVRLR